MKCLNCGAEIPDRQKYCDYLCNYGFNTKAYNAMVREQKK